MCLCAQREQNFCLAVRVFVPIGSCEEFPLKVLKTQVIKYGLQPAGYDHKRRVQGKRGGGGYRITSGSLINTDTVKHHPFFISKPDNNRKNRAGKLCDSHQRIKGQCCMSKIQYEGAEYNRRRVTKLENENMPPKLMNPCPCSYNAKTQFTSCRKYLSGRFIIAMDVRISAKRFRAIRRLDPRRLHF